MFLPQKLLLLLLFFLLSVPLHAQKLLSRGSLYEDLNIDVTYSEYQAGGIHGTFELICLMDPLGGTYQGTIKYQGRSTKDDSLVQYEKPLPHKQFVALAKQIEKVLVDYTLPPSQPGGDTTARWQLGFRTLTHDSILTIQKEPKVEDPHWNQFCEFWNELRSKLNDSQQDTIAKL